MFERLKKQNKPSGEQVAEYPLETLRTAREILALTGVRVHAYVDTGEAVRVTHNPDVSSSRAIESFLQHQASE